MLSGPRRELFHQWNRKLLGGGGRTQSHPEPVPHPLNLFYSPPVLCIISTHPNRIKCRALLQNIQSIIATDCNSAVHNFWALVFSRQYKALIRLSHPLFQPSIPLVLVRHKDRITWNRMIYIHASRIRSIYTSKLSSTIQWVLPFVL